jgi:hypothetical protein
MSTTWTPLESTAAFLTRTVLALGLASALVAAPAAAQTYGQNDGQGYRRGYPPGNGRGTAPASPNYDSSYGAQGYGSQGYGGQGADDQSLPGNGQAYGYVRVLEGAATLTQGGSGNQSALELNQPVMAGDRISVQPRSRLELLLADHNIVRLDGGSEIELAQLAASPDRNDRETVLRLSEGNLELVVTQDSLGQELPSVETPNATVYAENYGTYRVTTDQGQVTEVLARRGSLQVASDQGDVRVRAGEEAVIDGQQRGNGEVQQASAYDSLERWGSQLDNEAQGANLGYVDDSLRYQAASLSRYGSWIDDGGTQYWHPNGVSSDWRPYWHGDWQYTPTGYSWVSSEPWGWATYHYGTWDYRDSYGWCWRPGYVYSPAWVYWYWGPSHVGWCPVGFYTDFYGGLFPGVGFRFGLYGWAGGFWGGFDRWSFVDFDHFGRHRDFDRFCERGDHLRARLGDRFGREFPRGIITTDTRRATPAVLRNPGRAMQVLGAGRGGNLPDVTRFVARDPHIPANVLHAVRADRPGAGSRMPHLDGTPFNPSTLGTHPRIAGAIGGGVVGGGQGGQRGLGSQAQHGNPGLQAMPGTRGGFRPFDSTQHGGAGRPNLQGLTPDTRGARPNLQGLTPDARGARPSVQGLTPDARGAQPYRSNPQGGSFLDRHQPPSVQPSQPFGGGQAHPFANPRSAGPSLRGLDRSAPTAPAAPSSPYRAAPRDQAGPRIQATPGYQANPRIQAAPRFEASPRIQAAPRFNAPQRDPSAPQPRYQPPQRFQPPPRYDSAPRIQAAPRDQTAPRYQAAPRFESAPRYQAPPRVQAAPRYESAPRYQAAPRVQAAPRYESAPRYQAAPRAQAAPHYSQPAPRQSAPPPSRQGGGGGGGGNGGNQRHRGPGG